MRICARPPSQFWPSPTSCIPWVNRSYLRRSTEGGSVLVRNPVYDTARAHLAERGIATGRYFAPILFCSLLGGWAQRFLNSN